MIIGIGVDMIRIDRIAGSIARFGDRFLLRVYSKAELAEAKNGGRATLALAAGFLLAVLLARRRCGKRWAMCGGGGWP